MADRSNEFASNLRAYRAKADLSQVELAKRVGVNKDSVGNWEDGKYMPSLGIAVRVANTLGVSLDQLVGREATLVNQ